MLGDGVGWGFVQHPSFKAKVECLDPADCYLNNNDHKGATFTYKINQLIPCVRILNTFITDFYL